MRQETTGRVFVDVVDDALGYAAACGAEALAEFAAFWMTEIDEVLLSSQNG